MKTCGALLVLLCCCLTKTQLRGETVSENDLTHQGHYGEAESRENEVTGTAEGIEDVDTASIQQHDILTALTEMSALIAEQRVELRYTKTQVDAVEARLRASERQVEQLKSENEAQAASLSHAMVQVEQLMTDRENSRVSFSASLVPSGSEPFTGPFSDSTPLIFRHVFTNIGNDYNANNGIFTARVQGVYHFSLFLHGYGHKSTRVAAELLKNGEWVVSSFSHLLSGNMSPSNGASLLLKVGDKVYVRLRSNAWVYNHVGYTTFSGHLLFSMPDVIP